MKLPSLHLSAPAAIAYSGGGDSTALLHAFRGNPAVTHAFIIDHALREGSAEEVATAAAFAKSLGYQVKTQRWAHGGLSTGIQVKARAYRYQVMGEFCRAEQLPNLITAHTQDDQAETLLMRLERQTGWRGLAGMPKAAYGPLWPALAGVTLHRPWLSVSREDLRSYNAKHGLSFVDDPSNENQDFARVRARQALAGDKRLRDDLLSQSVSARDRLDQERRSFCEWLEQYALIGPHGNITLTATPDPELMLHLLNAVSGQGGPIDAAKRARLCEEMTRSDFKAATLAGAWVVKQPRSNGHAFVCTRDKVAVTGRRDLPQIRPMELESGQSGLWDGRFFCWAKTQDLRVEPAQGHLQNLRQRSEFKSLFDLPVEVRPTLPVFFLGDDPVGYGADNSEFVRSVACSALRLQALFLISHIVSQ